MLMNCSTELISHWNDGVAAQPENRVTIRPLSTQLSMATTIDLPLLVIILIIVIVPNIVL